MACSAAFLKIIPFTYNTKKPVLPPISKNSVKSKLKAYQVDTDENYPTVNGYASRKTYDVRSLSTVTIVPIVSNENNADLQVLIAVREFDNADELQDSDFHFFDEKSGMSNGDKPTDNTITLLPALQGVTAVRYQARSTVADSSSEITVHYRGYA